MKEDYVSYEVAKLLKEKWFPINEFLQNKIGDYKGIPVSKITEEMIEEKMLSCIPQSIVMKWLREAHKIIITIDYDEYELTSDNKKVGYGWTIQKIENPTEYLKINEHVFDSYEESIEDAIKYCLENIIL